MASSPASAASSSVTLGGTHSLRAMPYLISPLLARLQPHLQPQAEVPRIAADNLCQSTGHPSVVSNRVREILWHIPWYGFKTQARLARDSGVSPAAISRLIRGESQPSLVVALHVTQALSRRLGRPLDISEVFSLDGTYPTPSVCHLTGCRNCLPPAAWDEEDHLRPGFQDVAAGAWSLPPAFSTPSTSPSISALPEARPSQTPIPNHPNTNPRKGVA